MVRYMCAADSVMQKIENGAIWSIHRQKRPLDIRPFSRGKVGYVRVGMLKPSVQNKPNVDENIRTYGQGHAGVFIEVVSIRTM